MWQFPSRGGKISGPNARGEPLSRSRPLGSPGRGRGRRRRGLRVSPSASYLTLAARRPRQHNRCDVHRVADDKMPGGAAALAGGPVLAGLLLLGRPKSAVAASTRRVRSTLNATGCGAHPLTPATPPRIEADQPTGIAPDRDSKGSFIGGRLGAADSRYYCRVPVGWHKSRRLSWGGLLE